jgi:large subunit ribosomal protein L4
MPQLDVLNIENEVVGKVDLAPWWSKDSNPSLIHQAVVAARAGARRGTHASKGRTEVRGGGSKPFRQKGTGRARQGTIRAPQMRGGGVVFGPHPRDYSKLINKKMSRKALQSALAHKAGNEGLLVVEDIALETPKTRDLVAAMDRFDIISALIVVDDVSDELERASRNLKWVKVITPDRVNTYDVLVHDTLMVTRGALQTLEGALSK